MRIQHNIMAMSAYRNYTNNVSAMKKNLERLSSGYKINRAGDDAAGLAISEKMRAQITGLETAQKNAKDGISLVQTAEGALTEVHDMLNRMVELATMSANGTYDDTTDRAQLQKEMDQLLEEINRIADSSNFNGINLLDGSMDTEIHHTIQAMQRITNEDGFLPDVNNELEVGQATIVHTDANANVTVGFSIDLHDVAFLNQDDQELTITITDADGATTSITVTGTGTDTTTTNDVLSGSALISAIIDAIGEDGITLGSNTFKVTADGDTGLRFEIDGTGTFAGASVSVSATDGSLIVADSAFVDNTERWQSDGTTPTTNISIQMLFTSGPGNFTAASQAGAYTALDGTDLTVTIGSTSFTFTFSTAGEGNSIDKDGGTIDIGSLATNDHTGEEIWDAIKDAINAAIRAYNADQESNATGTPPTYTHLNEVDSLTCVTFSASTTATLAETAETQGYEKKATGLTGKAKADYNAATTDIVNSNVATEKRLASTYFDLSKVLDENSVKNGGSITIGKTEYVFTTEDKKDSGTTKYVNISDAIDADGNVNWSRVAQLLTHAAKDNSAYTVGHDGKSGNIYITEKDGQTDYAKNGVSTLTTLEAIENTLGFKKVTSSTPASDARALTLQIGDTNESYNQLVVSIRDCHADSLGIGDISIADQQDAADAIEKIKSAINVVSDVRGTLGATQNRLDHTINNLSVMTENIQDAESTIRDTDIAEEMMAYTKNNILIQSAQAMLAQANQVPQGVLQLLQ